MAWVVRTPFAGTTVAASGETHGSWAWPGRHNHTVLPPLVSAAGCSEAVDAAEVEADPLPPPHPLSREASTTHAARTDEERPRCRAQTDKQRGCIVVGYGEMASESTPVYRFGDLLALARQSWLREMADALRSMGYPDYRRSDAQSLRLLQREPVTIGRLGEALGVTRQAARKVATGLERRGFAVSARDIRDARQVNLTLTPEGDRYAEAIVTVIERMNRSLSERVRPADLAAADTVLRSVLIGGRARTLAEQLGRPGGDRGPRAAP